MWRRLKWNCYLFFSVEIRCHKRGHVLTQWLKSSIFLKFTRRDEFIVVLYLTTFLSLQLYTGCFLLEIFFALRWVTIITLTANILCLHSYIFNVMYNLSTRNIKCIQENDFYEEAIHGSFVIFLTISVVHQFAGWGMPGLFPERTQKKN